MKVFLTGATGFIGNALMRRVLDRGDEVRLLIRPGTPFPMKHPRIRIFRGSLEDAAILREGMRGCDAAFHLAAHVRVASKDRSLFDLVNLEGTRRVIEAAFQERVRKVVYTSSVVAIGPSAGAVADEETPRKTPYLTDYERTKALAEREIQNAVQKGFPAVIVSPSLVYGPTDLFKRYSFNRFLSGFIEGKWVPIPGSGRQVINPVYIDDVAEGHLLALEKGKIGENYILGGENVTINELAEAAGRLAKKKPSLWRLPFPVLKGLSRIELFLSKLQGREPRVTPRSLEIYRHDWAYSSAKAIRELGYRPTPLSKGLEKMAEWILKEGKPARKN